VGVVEMGLIIRDRTEGGQRCGEKEGVQRAEVNGGPGGVKLCIDDIWIQTATLCRRRSG